MGLRPLNVKGPHPLLWAGSRAARGKITISGIHNCLKYCAICFMIYTQFTNLGAGRGLETNTLRFLSILLNIMKLAIHNSARRSQRKETPLYDMLDDQLLRLHQRVRNRKPLCYSLTHSNHVPILCTAVVIFTRYSTSPLTQCSFVLRSNDVLIPSIGLLPSGCIMLYYILNAQTLFSPIQYHTANRIFWTIRFLFSCFVGLCAYLTENRIVTRSEQGYHACAMYTADRVIIEGRYRK